MSLPQSDPEIVYPQSDGKPMADNTLQAAWIVALYTNLQWLFRQQTALVAADLFWYPVEGNPKIVTAPDVMVALGRPEGYRSSYKQWEESDQPPQVVFEVLSPSNTPLEMVSKTLFYQNYGVDEFILIDAEVESFRVFLRQEQRLVEPDFPLARWQSPRLGISLEIVEGKLKAFLPDGSPFKTLQTESERAEQAEAELERLKEELARLKNEENS